MPPEDTVAKKLTLAKETLRSLSDSALKKAVGGWYGPGTGYWNCQTGGGTGGGGGTYDCPHTQGDYCFTLNYDCQVETAMCPSKACATRDYTACEECVSVGYTGCNECG